MDVFQVLFGLLVIVGLLALGRLLFHPGGMTIDDLLTRPDLAWPRGVQEDEPAPWHFERLTPPGHRRAQRTAAEAAARQTRAPLLRRDRRRGAPGTR